MNKASEITMGRRWLMFASIFLVGVLAAFCQFKAPVLFATEFTSELGFTDASIGWVMSIFSLIGVVLAFPAGGVLAKLGAKKSLIITAAALAIGAGAGALAQSATMMLATRFIEGIGMGLISVVGPAAVAEVIPQNKQGLAMGIWSVWFPAGVVVAFNVVPFIYAAAGTWRAAWWFACIVAVIAIVFVVLVYIEAKKEPAEQQEAQATSIKLKPDMVSVILIAVLFCAWNIFNAGAIGGFYPSYLTDVYQMDTQQAGSVSSITNILVLALGPISGFVADKFNLHKSLMVFAMVGAVVMLTFAFGDNLTLTYVFVVGFSVFSACCATGVFSSVPLYARDPAKIGFCMAIVAFLQNMGGVIGSAAFGPLAASVGWNSASLMLLVPVAVVGLACGIFIKKLK
ncbi:nitrate/nitrite transporter [Gordonibacter sp. RACS_AR68]|uniref:MFS transporter n=1 Tax=Gordonibacter sp. RACS_AR68 TaxID=2872005 RepID=UPI00260D8890|nr:MFS transporter [Gordonibacter sp. RACS_AR68]MDN4471360.1 MFS transporter [Gordonibacter sp. RACS_AR68]